MFAADLCIVTNESRLMTIGPGLVGVGEWSCMSWLVCSWCRGGGGVVEGVVLGVGPGSAWSGPEFLLVMLVHGSLSSVHGSLSVSLMVNSSGSLEVARGRRRYVWVIFWVWHKLSHAQYVHSLQ